MTEVDDRVTDRASRGSSRSDERRDALADAALATLAQQGYARTSLRDIAANSPFSHGVVHYYFEDKIELILTGVRRYKARCATRYDEVVATSTTADELAERFADATVASLVDEAHLHRLWYDLRSQSYFDEALRADVLEIDQLLQDMVWRVVDRWFELRGDGAPTVDARVAYGNVDGIFQFALLRHLAQPDDDAPELRSAVLDTLNRLAV